MNDYCKNCKHYRIFYEHSHVCDITRRIIYDIENIEHCAHFEAKWRPEYKHDGITTWRRKKWQR